jgi:hypothetical protein
MLIGTKQTDGGSLRVATPESKIAVTSKDSVIRETSVAAYTVPTDFPESDGTLEWDKTTLVLVNASAGDKVGIGYTYAGPRDRTTNQRHALAHNPWNGCHERSRMLVGNETRDSQSRTVRYIARNSSDIRISHCRHSDQTLNRDVTFTIMTGKYQLHRITIYRILGQTLSTGPVSTPDTQCSPTGLPCLFLKSACLGPMT